MQSTCISRVSIQLFPLCVLIVRLIVRLGVKVLEVDGPDKIKVEVDGPGEIEDGESG